jgi:hypothetical protein
MMTNKRILVIGGYGNFGTFIVRRLAREQNLTVIVAGRSGLKARALARDVNSEWAQIDIFDGFEAELKKLRPDILIHTSGPFQGQGYEVAQACIRNGVHYLDLADGRAFVSQITRLDEAAKAAGVLVVSGASTVPGLTGAVVTKYAGEFAILDEVDFGIGTAQKSDRGLATVKAILGYAGKPFRTLVDGEMRNVYGWQDLRWRKFRNLGWRALANCDVPDLDLLPACFPTLKSVRFRGGLELPLLHFGLWSLTWLVRGGLVSCLRPAAPLLLGVSNLFDVFGTNDSGFYVEMMGQGLDGQPKKLAFDLTAREGDGLLIPCTPAVVLAIQLASGKIGVRGATPCMNLLAFDDILQELAALRISWGLSRTA